MGRLSGNKHRKLAVYMGEARFISIQMESEKGEKTMRRRAPIAGLIAKLVLGIEVIGRWSEECYRKRAGEAAGGSEDR